MAEFKIMSSYYHCKKIKALEDRAETASLNHNFRVELFLNAMTASSSISDLRFYKKFKYICLPGIMDCKDRKLRVISPLIKRATASIVKR